MLHYRDLQLYTDLGLKVKKVHRVLEFNQSPWLRQYKERTQAKNSFEKDFLKLMNSSVFGKTIENLRKRVDIKLVTDEKKTTFVTCKIFNEKLVVVHKIKETLTLNRLADINVRFSL